MVPSHIMLRTLWVVVKVTSFSNMAVFSLQASSTILYLFTIFYHVALRIVCQTYIYIYIYMSREPTIHKIPLSYTYLDIDSWTTLLPTFSSFFNKYESRSITILNVLGQGKNIKLDNIYFYKYLKILYYMYKLEEYLWRMKKEIFY